MLNVFRNMLIFQSASKKFFFLNIVFQYLLFLLLHNKFKICNNLTLFNYEFL